MCCSSNEGVFAWIGALLVNIAFISLITWGAATLWPVGFVLSALYTAFLLFLARWKETHTTTRGSYRNVEDGNNAEEDDTVERQGDYAVLPSSATKFPILVSLLYGLGVLSLGVTGFFLPVNVFPPCTGSSSSFNHPKYTWKTNATALPSSVRKWATNDQKVWADTSSGATFAYVPSTGITIFQGTDFAEIPPQPSRLWTVQGNNAPVEHDEFGFPSPFIPVSEDVVCFQSEPKPANSQQKYKGFFLYCSDGVSFRQEQFDESNPASFKEHFAMLNSYNPVNGTLWFKEMARAGGDSGTMVYSLNPETMISTLHSTRIPYESPGNEDDCNPHEVKRRRALLSLLVSVIPMTALSIVLWKMKQVPSMGILSYVNLSLIYITVHFAISPDYTQHDAAPFHRWFAISGMICLLVSAHLLLSIQSSLPSSSISPFCINTCHEEPLRASLVTSAVAFAWGGSMWFLFNDFDDHDTLGWWILWNVLVSWPLIFVGAATDSVSVLCLGGLGFLADAFRLAALEDSTLFFFLVFSLTGLAVGILGYYFSTRYQPAIQRWSQAQVQVVNRWLLAKYQQNRYQRDVENGDNVDPDTLLSQMPSSTPVP
jgi:membrane protein implicated in regulation of membrane protease activity